MFIFLYIPGEPNRWKSILKILVLVIGIDYMNFHRLSSILVGISWKRIPSIFKPAPGTCSFFPGTCCICSMRVQSVEYVICYYLCVSCPFLSRRYYMDCQGTCFLHFCSCVTLSVAQAKKYHRNLYWCSGYFMSAINFYCCWDFK